MFGEGTLIWHHSPVNYILFHYNGPFIYPLLNIVMAHSSSNNINLFFFIHPSKRSTQDKQKVRIEKKRNLLYI